MAKDTHNYIDLLALAMPPGDTITPIEGSNIWNILLPAARQFSTVHDRMANKVGELSFPGTTVDWLADWEFLIKPHGTCLDTLVSDADRRKAMKDKFTSTGGNSKAFIEQAAVDLGYSDANLSVYYFRSFVGGFASGYVTGVNWVHVLRLTATSIPATDEILMCTIRDIVRSGDIVHFELT